MMRERRGRAYDPDVADGLAAMAEGVLADFDQPAMWDLVMSAEPGSRPILGARQFDDALIAIAHFSDLKIPYLAGHSPAVAGRAEEAARELGLPEDDVVTVRHAALVHEIGRTSVPNAIWEKPRPLSESEWERVRLYPHYTDRIFARPARLRRIGELAAMHRERLDGSGYHRRLHGRALPILGRILAAADAYQSMIETRPYRPALTAEAAAAELRREVRAGKLDGEAVEAVLRAAGHGSRRRQSNPLGLTSREIEVLRLLARGQSRKQIAKALAISPHTADHHIRHIYEKIGTSTRAGAVLAAMQNDLLDPGTPERSRP
jgi:HD-GYP domain-containing protein (c-di-GMP phosphodiesterase class II)